MIRIKYCARLDGFAEADDGEYVAVKIEQYQEMLSRSLLTDDLLRTSLGTAVEIEALQAHKSAFYRMRDRVVLFVKAIRKHKRQIRYEYESWQFQEANKELWELTKDFPGADG